MGASTVTVGLIEGIGEATANITKLASGLISDRWGRRKPLAALGYGLSTLSKPLFALAPSAGIVLGARFADRVGQGIRGAPRDALVADIAPPELRGASFGLRQSLDTVGAFLGPLLAIGLMWLTADHFPTVFWIAVLPAVLSVAVLLAFVGEPERPGGMRRVHMPLRRDELRRLGADYWRVVAIAAMFTLARFTEAFLILRAQSLGLPVMLVPAVMVLMALAYSLSAYPVGVLSDRRSRITLLVAGLALLVAADIALAFAAGMALLALGVVLWGLHMGFTQGLLATLIADTAPPELRGTAFGMFNLVTGLALLAASVIAGALWDAAGPRATFLASAAFTGLTLIGLWAIRSSLDHRS